MLKKLCYQDVKYFTGTSTYSCRREEGISIRRGVLLERYSGRKYYAGDDSYEHGEEIIREILNNRQFHHYHEH